MKAIEIKQAYDDICKEALFLEQTIEEFEKMLLNKKQHLVRIKSEMIRLDRLIQSEGDTIDN